MLPDLLRYTRITRGEGGDIRIGSVCTGYGGLDLGLQQAIGGTLAWCADNDKTASEILCVREPHAPNLGDIRLTNWRQVERIDWLTGGYPCQPFSVSGYRKGEDDERNVWPDVLTALRVLRPRFVLLENVRGHLSKGFGRVLGDLASVGYLGSWVCVRASDIGAPHGRERVFILATDGWQTDTIRSILNRTGQDRTGQK